MRKRKSWIVLLFLVVILSACSLLEQAEKIEKSNTTFGTIIEMAEIEQTEQMEEPKKQELSVLEQFGRYMETLIAEGRRSEVNSYRISHPLTIEEGKSLAKESPIFTGYSEYGVSEESLLLEADLNQDGIPDLVEAQIRNGTAKLNSLVIYIRGKENFFHITEYQPEFEAVKRLSGYDELSVVSYQGEIFLLFEEGYSWSDSPSHNMSIYLLQNGQVIGKYKIQYEYTTITARTIFCEEERKEKAEGFCQGAESYYRAIINDPIFRGNAEKPIQEGSKEEVLLKRLGEEEKKEYEETYSKEGLSLLFYSVTTLTGAKWYQSDLDNDGIEESYVKGSDYLGMRRFVVFDLYKTGELYGDGKYEGKIGLNYLMEKDGIRTDFEKVGNLNIWQTERIPQIFWIESCGEENIVWMLYRDPYYFRAWIDGYRMKDGKNEKVLSVEYQPEVSIQATCEWKTEEELEEILTYGIYLEEKEGIDYPRVYGLEDAILQEEIERNTEKFFQEEGLEVGKPIRWELKWDGSALYQVISATKEKVVLRYLMLFEVGERGTSEDIYLTIHVKTGEICFCEDWEAEQEMFQKENRGW